MAASDMYKSGKLHGWQPKVISSWLDGKKARFHPELLRKATPAEINDVRIPTMVHDAVHEPAPPSVLVSNLLSNCRVTR